MPSTFYPRKFIADLDGKALEGSIRVGAENQDPDTSPIPLFWDEGLTIPAPQPVQISGGYIVNGGTRAELHMGEATWSFRVRNKAGVQVDYAASAPEPVTAGSMVAFQQAGTGAVPTTVQAALRLSVYAQHFGAKGDGSTDDYAALTNALAYLQSVGGGDLIVPATGSFYRLTHGLVVGNGIRIIGQGQRTYPGDTATLAQWAAAGTWFKSEDTVNPTIKFQGHGFGAIDLNFMRTQPTPTTGTYAPTIYPYEIEVTTSNGELTDLFFLNSSHDINFAYTTTSGGGTMVKMRDIFMGGLRVGLRTSMVNDTMKLTNIRHRSLWYMSNTSRFNDLANTVGWNCGYTDNPMIDGMELVFCGTGVKFFNETCLGITHSLYNAQIANLQLSLNNQGMIRTVGDEAVTGQIANLLCQQGPGFGAPISTLDFLDLRMAGLNLKIAHLNVIEAGGTFANIGNGTGAGKLSIDSANVDGYSTGVANKPLFTVAANSTLRIGNKSFAQGGGATPKGAFIAGAGIVEMPVQSWLVYDRFGEATGTCNGSAQDASTDYQATPADTGISQIRIKGEINITAAVAAATLQIKLANQPTVTATVSAATTGFKSFDSGWIDITSGLTTAIGRVQLNGTNAVQWSNGSLAVMMR